MAIFKGIKTYVANAKETTWGTAVSRTLTKRVKSCSINAKAVPAVVDDLSEYHTARTDAVLTDMNVEGDIVENIAYQGNGFGRTLYAALGTMAEGAGAGPTYTHTATPGPLGSWTQEKQQGDSATTEVFSGAMCSKLMMEFPARGLCTATSSWICKSAAARSSTTVTAPTNSPVYARGHEMGQFTFNSVAYTGAKITVTVDNGLEGIDEHASSSMNPGAIERMKPVEVYVDVELNQRDNVLYAAFIAKTQAALSFTVSDGTRSLAFTFGRAFLETYDDSISGPGPIVAKARFRCLSDPSTPAEAISVVLTNGDDTYEDT